MLTLTAGCNGPPTPFVSDPPLCCQLNLHYSGAILIL